MTKALRVHIALNEFVVGAICIAIMVCTFAYLKTHATQSKANCMAPVNEPTVEISQIIYYVPVPVKVKVKVEMPKPETPKVDSPAPAPQQEEQPDPVFQHRTPIITSALRTPISELDKK